MSTTSKGDRFELKTQKLLTQVLRNGRFELKLEGESEFWIVPKDSDVFNKKKYKYVYGSKVIIDVSIESPVESEVPSLVIVECKDLSRKVDKGDMGEFCLKVQDLNAKKGIFVTNNGFQKGAIEMAKYHNIALIRIDEKNTLVWDLHRIRGFRNISYLDITELLISDVPTMPSVVFDGYIYYTSVIDYFYSLFYISDLRLDKKIPFYSNEQIQKQVDLFLNWKKYIKISNEILKFYIIRQNILLCNETVSPGFLGRYDFYNNKISIAEDLQNDEHRYRFTLAHEIGHAVLHRKLLKGLIASADDDDVLSLKDCSKWERRLEIQANLFASYLLVPKAPLYNLYMEVKRKLNINDYVPLYLDEQPCNIEDCYKMFYVLSKIFNVSKEVIKYRLKNEKLLLTPE